ncbi:hypothetical protein [Gallaecimonas sp. GXIMD4217]|uniref:hypothetical protein n=1 Tax=Gallaecimonas sp. GXIMD4217 TaxID=3131927 RepID=UPI00311B0E9E
MSARQHFEEKLKQRLAERQAESVPDQLWQRIETELPDKGARPLWWGVAAALVLSSALLVQQSWHDAAKLNSTSITLLQYEVHTVDKKLQQAYLQDAGQEEIETILRQRQYLMDALAYKQREAL